MNPFSFGGASPPDTPSFNAASLEPGLPYACCIKPFVAITPATTKTCNPPPGDTCTAGEHANDMFSNATPMNEPAHSVTLEIPGHGSITVPTWFAATFISAVPAFDVPPHSPGGVFHVLVPSANVDEQRLAFAAPRGCSFPGWRVFGSFGDLTSSNTNIEPPALLGTTDERAAIAHADVGLVLCETGAVSRAVVPALVTRHVVGPYASMLRCTVAQACLGVTTFDADDDASLGKMPNVTDLLLRFPPSNQLPPATRRLTVDGNAGRMQHCANSGTPSQHGPAAPLCFHSLAGLVELTLYPDIDPDCLLNAVPIPTLQTLTVSRLRSENRQKSIELVQRLSAMTPNVVSLAITAKIMDCDESVDAAACFFFSDKTVWPNAKSLTIEGLWPAVAVMANARPWQKLTLTWAQEVSSFKTFTAEPLPSEISRHIRESSRLILSSEPGRERSSLEELTIVCADQSFAEIFEFFPAAAVAESLRTLTLSDVLISLKPCQAEIATAAAEPNSAATSTCFFARARSLKRVQVGDLDLGNGLCRKEPSSNPFAREDTIVAPTPLGPEVESAVLSSAFAPSVQCVAAERRGAQWKRSHERPSQWHKLELRVDAPSPHHSNSIVAPRGDTVDSSTNRRLPPPIVLVRHEHDLGHVRQRVTYPSAEANVNGACAQRRWRKY